MEKPVTKEKPKTVTSIIKTGVDNFLTRNQNISVNDFLTPNSRQKAKDQLKTTFKSSALDTGQNIINHLRKEEVSRRKRPSNVRKAKRLEYALLTLKQKKDDAKKAGALKEDIPQFDKLVKTIRSTSNLSPEKKINCLKIAGKVRGMKTCESRVFKEGIGTMTDADIARTGATPEMQAKVRAKRDAKLKNQKPTTQKSSGETKQLPGQKGISGSDNNKSLKSGKDEKDTSSSNNKDGAIVKSKGSALATKGKKDNEVKDERKPKPYRDKKKERKGIKGPSKDAINKTVSKVGSAAKSGLSAFTSGYDNENVKEQKSFNQYAEDAYAAKQGAGAWMLGKGLEGIANVVKLGSTIFNMSKKKDEVKRPKDPVKPTPKDGESWTGGIEGRPTRNLSGRYQTYKKNQKKLKDFNDTLTTSSPGVEYKKQPKPNITKGDNPESRENIRKDLDKINQKNNKLYNNYHNPKPPG